MSDLTVRQLSIMQGYVGVVNAHNEAKLQLGDHLRNSDYIDKQIDEIKAKIAEEQKNLQRWENKALESVEKGIGLGDTVKQLEASMVEYETIGVEVGLDIHAQENLDKVSTQLRPFTVRR